MIVTVRARGRIGGVRHHGLVRAAHADLGVEGGGQKEEAGGAASLGRLRTQNTEAVASVLKIEKSRSAVKVPISPMCS